MQLKTARGVPRSPLEQGLTDEALPGSQPLVSDRNSFHDPLEGLDYEAATLPGHDVFDPSLGLLAAIGDETALSAASRHTPNSASVSSMQEWCGREHLMDGPKTVEERVAWTTKCAKQAGFAHIDDFFRIYYTESFDSLSSVYEAQRVSRTRRLGQTLQTFCLVSGHWPERERRPYRAEILAAAEKLYTAELRSALDAGMMNLGCDSHYTTATDGETLRHQKQNLQEQLPNLWALLVELTADSSVGEVGASLNAILKVLSIISG
ncbi:hypothetical protein LEL_10966 [Akanthomyces lecanii RCEF 1005]|uniref:Uncharacterized protein n=1 Tax=Akanthomyces lecanii RCEF 1005 TaxID=1081108 RepID=A0A167P7C4_CORDF|nr:hypothetical protein LEL_10966 [Akanthomyces lecanii RCEF 1005]